MKLLVGLGNPGAKYELTRHNAGFLVIDRLAERYGAGAWNQKFEGQFSRCDIDGESCVLLKPMTFMNLSGKSVQQAQKFFKIDITDVVVVHDDIDVPFGKVKARQGGGNGGHNGIRSIIQCAGRSDFQRIKLGVGRPVEKEDGDVVSWVLNRFSDEQLQVLTSAMLEDTVIRLKGIFKQTK